MVINPNYQLYYYVIFLLIVNSHQLGLIMTYKFSDITEEAILIILSIVPIGICLSIFISDGWTTPILAFFISAFDFYYVRSNNRKNKSRIKELSNINDTIKFSFFYKSKHALVVKKTHYHISTNEMQIIFTTKDKSTVLGIANKQDMEEPEKWSDLIACLTINNN